ncbi:MAG: (E)-4-hydroxy-3-methylbut-2-enyl-diphosphate synthase [Armatimonadota bacterium]
MTRFLLGINNHMWQTEYPRRHTRKIALGRHFIGGDAPVLVQSMINVPTHDVPSAVEAIKRLADAGAEAVRFTVPTMADAEAVHRIREQLLADGCDTPLIADVHHTGQKIAIRVASAVDKVRINPGLYVMQPADELWSESEAEQQIGEALSPLLAELRAYGHCLRLGVNHGSLAPRMILRYGDTPEGMVQSALEYARICRKLDFEDIVISFKASRVPTMLAANRLAAIRMAEEGFDCPLHLGVTEAGDGSYGRTKSIAGIATLLLEGIGDTIRVSLSEDPEKEIPVCFEILQATGHRKTKVEYIACPSCGRTQFDLQRVLSEVREATQHLVGLDIAVMGCIVNGPGEMADADYGYVGKGANQITLYRGKQPVKTVHQSEGVAELVALLKADGKWKENG